MLNSALLLIIEEERIVPVLQETSVSLDGAHTEAVLDFSAVQRINSDALRALEDFVRAADEKAVKVVLRGVRIDVYKVLKHVKLTQRLRFLQ
ncbi:MAG TPA: STAS domain-containing protein [Candidatus Sulfotelmatobacter sp.]|nr:STAS domain-containing protein [Candidatus Sulfotelmatobacter sp.]